MVGIVANAISTPCGNCARNEADSFLFSSFCKMAPPVVMPQIYIHFVIVSTAVRGETQSAEQFT